MYKFGLLTSNLSNCSFLLSLSGHLALGLYKHYIALCPQTAALSSAMCVSQLYIRLILAWLLVIIKLSRLAIYGKIKPGRGEGGETIFAPHTSNLKYARGLSQT